MWAQLMHCQNKAAMSILSLRLSGLHIHPTPAIVFPKHTPKHTPIAVKDSLPSRASRRAAQATSYGRRGYRAQQSAWPITNTAVHGAQPATTAGEHTSSSPWRTQTDSRHDGSAHSLPPERLKNVVELGLPLPPVLVQSGIIDALWPGCGSTPAGKTPHVSLACAQRVQGLTFPASCAAASSTPLHWWPSTKTPPAAPRHRGRWPSLRTRQEGLTWQREHWASWGCLGFGAFAVRPRRALLHCQPAAQRAPAPAQARAATPPLLHSHALSGRQQPDEARQRPTPPLMPAPAACRCHGAVWGCPARTQPPCLCKNSLQSSQILSRCTDSRCRQRAPFLTPCAAACQERSSHKPCKDLALDPPW